MDSNLTHQVATAVTAATSEAGHSILALAEGTGIPRTTLLRRLSGRSSFTVAELEAIATFLKVEVARFIVAERVAS
jgi:transcriptional regulator with XRE-family HTH domain